MSQTSYIQFSVITPGLFTTMQDRGRYGYQKFGVPISGALDSFAAAIANTLVGNNNDAALLEISLLGPKLYALQDAVVAICGADIPVKHNGDDVVTWTAIRIRPKDILEIGEVVKNRGCRAYLAVSGGFAVSPIMGSRSCYVGGKFGGGFGRPLMAHDKLKRYAQIFPKILTELAQQYRPEFNVEPTVLRAIPGPQDDRFDKGVETFFDSEFIVSPDANRMGYRLLGPHIEQKRGLAKSITSEPSLPGGVQIPPNGNPIVLLKEQTVGGYAKIATVISTDLDRIAQACPGDRIRFQKTSLEEALRVRKSETEKRLKIQAELLAELENDTLSSVKSDDGADRFRRLFKELYPEC